MGSHELVRRSAHVCSGVIKHDVFDLHEFARAPQGGASIVEMRAESERLGAKPLDEMREGVRRALEGRLQALE